jgi:uncharacterized low-complexity protein
MSLLQHAGNFRLLLTVVEFKPVRREHMSKKSLIAAAAGTAFVASMAAAPIAAAAENPFALSGLASGYQVADNHAKPMEGKCGGAKAAEGKCGGDKAKAKEGKCGEGKCGGAKKMEEGGAKK